MASLLSELEAMRERVQVVLGSPLEGETKAIYERLAAALDDAGLLAAFAEVETHANIARFAFAAAASAAQFLSELPGHSHALEAGMVVCYARPFTTSHWIGALGKKWLPKGVADRRLHERLIELRNQWAAHTDAPGGRDIIRVIDGETTHPTYVTSVPVGLEKARLPRVKELCRSQRDRFVKEQRRLEAEAARDL